MIDRIALWLAQELLKFLAARLFRGKVQDIFDRWDDWDKAANLTPSRIGSMGPAAFAVTGQAPTIIQQTVLGLLYDPIKATLKK